ncbi:alpha-galactosidase [Lacticaseibacillus paracasei]|nr:alpha-galactosidase [Lacticaseibacillus paracasei]
MWFEWAVRFSETRKPAQKLSRKDLGFNDPKPVITPKATYVPVSKRAGLRS